MTYQHIPVLFHESIDSLHIKEDGIYVDATFGRGGHSRGILEKLGKNGRLYAFDRDLEAIEAAKAIDDPRFTITHTNFSKIKDVCEDLGILGQVDGILMDIGVSSPQIDDPTRGFSFDRDGPLDMRMDKSKDFSAKTIIDNYSAKDLAYIFKVYGEERFANKVANAIVKYREENELNTTKELANLIAKVIPGVNIGKHKATRCFQALRIAVNAELEELKQGLLGAIDVLADNGYLCVITFHSLEDRIVKQFIKEQSTFNDLPRGLPITEEELNKLRAQHATLENVSKPIKASDSELCENIRARSATLRVARRLVRGLK